jgi:hypothetical protein
MGFGLSHITHTNAKGGTKMNCEHCGKDWNDYDKVSIEEVDEDS